MMYPSRLQIIIGAVVIIAAGGVTIGIDYDMRLSGNAISGQAGISAPAAAVHTASWYVAHPAIAKRDETNCGDNAASISPAACQNIESAEEQLLADELHQAAMSNSAKAKPNAAQAP
ncbi:hypothetical protein AiwAL_18845 [Acidiphilium sp. AL]|uniref:hypothetical protein n=1 Tax=Acidiphilium sp. AL TaxID=2871704 RepID=UPI0021CB4242|nr:hypothetical protein [Acidiphilium sp. AL]MCU4162115.1 hypothetical protein [Acidiphilium sp. AL]